MLDCRFAECMFVQRLIPVFCLSKLKVSLKLGGGGGGEGGGAVSNWVSCCCTDTGLPSGMHLG